ncbi:hypothetical protein LSAT2_003719, partial [Lamellibrachia satsuma]
FPHFLHVCRGTPDSALVSRQMQNADFIQRWVFHMSPVEKIHVEHDNSGTTPAWYLKKILITNWYTYEKYNCMCYKWLQKGSLSREFTCKQMD